MTNGTNQALPDDKKKVKKVKKNNLVRDKNSYSISVKNKHVFFTNIYNS